MFKFILSLKTQYLRKNEILLKSEISQVHAQRQHLVLQNITLFLLFL